MMAILEMIYCSSCRQKKMETRSPQDYSTVCNECREAKRKKERNKHFEELDALTAEERLRKVEEWIYDRRQKIANPHF